jgi:plastocyanin
MKKLLIAMLLTIVVISLVGCSQSSSSTTSGQTSSVSSSTTSSLSSYVTISNFAFDPKELTVSKGTKVTWTNNDSVNHTITSDSGAFESGDLAKGDSFSFTFNDTGSFSYHCKIHPLMTAKIIVQ